MKTFTDNLNSNFKPKKGLKSRYLVVFCSRVVMAVVFVVLTAWMSSKNTFSEPEWGENGQK